VSVLNPPCLNQSPLQYLLDQVMLGSVNAARGHFQMSADVLFQVRLGSDDHIVALITNRYSYNQFVQPVC
jgi:hypothetical protein